MWLLRLLWYAGNRLHRPLEHNHCARHGCLCESCTNFWSDYIEIDGSTFIQLGYLLYVIINDGGTIPTLSIIMLAAIYGLQALIFIFRLRWDMIAWMFCKRIFPLIVSLLVKHLLKLFLARLDSLYPRYSHVLLLLAAIFLLVHGQLCVG